MKKAKIGTLALATLGALLMSNVVFAAAPITQPAAGEKTTKTVSVQKKKVAKKVVKKVKKTKKKSTKTAKNSNVKK